MDLAPSSPASEADDVFRQTVSRLLSNPPRPLPAEVESVEFLARSGSHLAQVRFGDGHTLMVKRARSPESSVGVRTERMAARLVREGSPILAPEHWELGESFQDPSLLVYWKLPYLTLTALQLEGVRSSKPPEALVVRDWGRLVRRLHQVRFPGHGRLTEVALRPLPLQEFLTEELTQRLEPAIRDAWPAGSVALERLLPLVPERVPADAPAVLVHNKLFSHNILCVPVANTLRCVGVLDLEDAFAGPAEAEFARTELLHGPLFGRHWEGPWLLDLLAGYQHPLDLALVAFFRVYHLLSMGLQAATGEAGAAHAAELAAVAVREASLIGSGLSHATVVTDLRDRRVLIADARARGRRNRNAGPRPSGPRVKEGDRSPLRTSRTESPE